MAVTETVVGTKPDGDEPKVSSKESVTPTEEKVSPKEEEKIYSQKQLDELLHMTKSEAGREKKAVETERDEFKTKAERLEADNSDIQVERDQLKIDIDELSSRSYRDKPRDSLVYETVY